MQGGGNFCQGWDARDWTLWYLYQDWYLYIGRSSVDSVQRQGLPF